MAPEVVIRPMRLTSGAFMVNQRAPSGPLPKNPWKAWLAFGTVMAYSATWPAVLMRPILLAADM